MAQFKETSTPSKESPRAKWRALAAGIMVLVGVSVAVAAAAMLIAARPTFEPAEMLPVEVQPLVATAEPTATKPSIARAPKRSAAVLKAPAARAVPAEMPRAEAAEVKAALVASESKRPIEESEAKLSGVEVPAPAEVLILEPAAVTIIGCLERDDDTFLLKGTTGVDAPKSRSWKSGFLKRRSSSIDVVDVADRLRLPDHVGQRVSVTGTLVDREMEARSLLIVAEYCEQ